MTEQLLDDFAKQYRHSDEELEDLKKAYENREGDMDLIFESVPLSDPVEDESRFREVIQTWIDEKKVEAYPSFTGEPARKRKRRQQRAAKEAKAAALVALERRASRRSGQLSTEIAKREIKRETGFATFAARYGVEAIDDEPSEEAFQAAQQKLLQARPKGKTKNIKSRRKQEAE